MMTDLKLYLHKVNEKVGMFRVLLLQWAEMLCQYCFDINCLLRNKVLIFFLNIYLNTRRYRLIEDSVRIALSSDFLFALPYISVKAVIC